MINNPLEQIINLSEKIMGLMEKYWYIVLIVILFLIVMFLGVWFI